MEKELRRNEQEGMLGGVCAGLGEYLAIDKVWIRVLFILSVFFSAVGIGLVGPIVYVVMWIVVPRKAFDFPDFREPHGRPPGGKSYYVGGENLFRDVGRKQRRERRAVGFVLLFVGCLFLLLQSDFITWDEFIKYWPLVLVIGGLFTIFTSFNGRGEGEQGEQIKDRPYEDEERRGKGPEEPL
ncbi:PspC domain-containing protein [Olivibacter sp. XZL3]|uniref:PspC domain-containing protein n=1 Tax=Olivibacter sp. XZL3 TaxID=1735116 RepID=UPI0010668B13|nr:PspC domain-containing protein [Olivibacter sp. XZL3]